MGAWVESLRERLRFHSWFVRPLDRMNARERGLAGERLAARFLARSGHRILARRFKTRLGELDLVTADQDTLVVVEVKTGTFGPGYRPGHRVTQRDASRLSEAARELARSLGFRHSRVDVVEVLVRRGGVPPRVLHHPHRERHPGLGRSPRGIELL